jgi:coproporphyrinogen III oxidase-like Fe-S oxidoreductase
MGRRPLAGDELLTDEQLALEELMLALRTPEGVNLGAFRRRHRIDLLAVNPGLCERLEADELVLIDRDHLQLTPAGLVVAEGLAASLRLRPPPP